MFITNGVLANLYFVAAKTDRDGQLADPSPCSGGRNTPAIPLAARSTSTAGARPTPPIGFDNCRIPAENRLGEEGRGFYAIMQNFQNERTTIGAAAIGKSQAAIDLTLDYVRTRKAFGAPLWQRETIRQRLAMLASKVEAGHQLVYHAAWLASQGIDATKEVSMVKAYCGELVNEVMYNCVQFHGGMGFMRESTIERWRATRASRTSAAAPPR